MLNKRIRLDFYNAAGLVLLGSVTVSADTRSLLLTNAELQTLLGGSQVSFQLRATLVTDDDWWQLESEENTINVTKV